MRDPELELVLFRGFGGSRVVCLAGRVQYRSQLVPDGRGRGLRRRLKDAWRLLVSRHVPSAELTLRYGDHTWHAMTDSHGYFFHCHDVDDDPGASDGLWHGFTCRAEHVHSSGSIEATGQVLTAPHGAERLIISDIDDTIVQTGVANKLKMLWHLYFADAQERRPFKEMDDFLRRMHGGGSGDARNPMIYVSRSPWSIYPMLEAFFDQHDIPVGPVLLLRDWGISWRHPVPRRAEDHKSRMIDSTLQAFPGLPVVLIGDSGQHDPEVYADVADRYPNRIQGIYIRDLSLSGRRTAELRRMADHFATLGIDFVVSGNTAGFVSHARAQGWLNDGAEPAAGSAGPPDHSAG